MFSLLKNHLLFCYFSPFIWTASSPHLVVRNLNTVPVLFIVLQGLSASLFRSHFEGLMAARCDYIRTDSSG